MEIVRIFISEGHNFFGRHGLKPRAHPMVEVERADCVAGRGLRGDRFFDFKDDYKGQVTFFAEEVYDDLCARFRLHDRAPDVFRRNVITRGGDLGELIGAVFEIDGVQFEGVQEASPCYWMNGAFCDGAEEALRGRGGLRARILSSGVIRVGGLISAHPAEAAG